MVVKNGGQPCEVRCVSTGLSAASFSAEGRGSRPIGGSACLEGGNPIAYLLCIREEEEGASFVWRGVGGGGGDGWWLGGMLFLEKKIPGYFPFLYTSVRNGSFGVTANWKGSFLGRPANGATVLTN